MSSASERLTNPVNITFAASDVVVGASPTNAIIPSLLNLIVGD